MTATKTLTVKCKAFAGETTSRAHRVQVADGVVRVWDDVAGYYTTCHSIAPRTQARIVRLALTK